MSEPTSNKDYYVKDYDKVYQKSIENPEAFWDKIAQDLDWYKKYKKVLNWKYPHADWFVNGKCNIVQNALDRHLKTPTKNTVALLWEGQNGEVKKYTYLELDEEVSRLATGLKKLGIKKGDIVTIYLPKIPEIVFSMLACAKIGAIHSVVFSGFSSDALKGRVEESGSRYIITCDGYYYREKLVNLKQNVDSAIGNLPVKKCIVVNNNKLPIQLNPSRDIWYTEITNENRQLKTEIMDSSDPLFILYTSGTTGKPKAIVHAHGGYMVGIYLTLKWIFNLEKNDIYWCSADPGWITGHSYLVYSPLINGITTYIYEGPPDYPDLGVWWSKIEKHKVTQFYTAPTAIRGLMKFGKKWPQKSNLKSLKILGSVGEPINPEAWKWFDEEIGNKERPIMDTWWQTETGMQMISPLPSVKLKPGSVFKSFPGVEADIVDNEGNSVPAETEGSLVIRKPWPAMFKTILHNDKLYRELYWEKIKGVYFSGDVAKKDQNGYINILGRRDDVINVSGHRFGSAELEAIVNSFRDVVESAVIGLPDEIKGEKIGIYAILKEGIKETEELIKEIKSYVVEKVGVFARPDVLKIVDKLPKTRSGKIMRRLLRAQELNLNLGDITTLED